LPPAGKLALITPAIAVPFLPFVSQGKPLQLWHLHPDLRAAGARPERRGRLSPGLLDLGYVAFFGFGAYTYAFLSGTHSNKGHVYTHHWDAQWSILAPCSSAPCSGSSWARPPAACSATTSRS
jgi:hypothetical protein